MRGSARGDRLPGGGTVSVPTAMMLMTIVLTVQVGVEVQVLEHLRPGLRAFLDLDLLKSVAED